MGLYIFTKSASAYSSKPNCASIICAGKRIGTVEGEGSCVGVGVDEGDGSIEGVAVWLGVGWLVATEVGEKIGLMVVAGE